MPYPTPDRPTPAQLRRLIVGQVVSADHGRRWADESAFGLAHAVECVAAVDLPDAGFVSPTTTLFAYAKSFAAKALKVTIELMDTNPVVAMTVDVTHSEAATGLWCGPSPFDGVASISTELPQFRFRSPHVAFLDVAAVTVGTIFDVSVVADGGSLFSVHLCEVPLADVDPVGAPTTEPSVNGAWPNVGNQLTDGGASDPYGFPRLMDQMEAERTEVRRHMQWAAPLDATLCAVVTGTSLGAASIQWRQDGAWSASYEPVFYMRARRLYDTTTSNRYTLRIWYMTTDAVQNGTIRAVINGTNNDLTLPASNGVWAVASRYVDVPTSTTGQQVQITFQAKIGASPQVLYLAQVALVELEPV